MSLDPMGFAAGDFDLYGYVGNSPLDATDPSGLIGGSPQYNAAYAAWYIAHPGYYQWSGPQWGLSLDDIIRSGDALVAGMAHSLTGGISTQFRSAVYGEIAEQNHQGGAFSFGKSVGAVIDTAIGFGNPCAMARSTGAMLRGLAGVQSAAGAMAAYGSYHNGDYLGAALAGAGAFGGFLQARSACFAAGTPILTPGGSRPIEQIRPGDWVIAAPEDDSEAPPEARLVEDVFENYSPLMDLRVGGQTIRTTLEHPFWVQGRGWTAAYRLAVGDRLKSHDGKWTVLEAIIGDQGPSPVYNFCVADYHTYFVGGEEWGFSVWAHNSTCVYKSIDPITGKVNYVGITNNFGARSAAHARAGLGVIPVGIPGMGSLTRAQARAVEQSLIEYHGLGTNGGTLLNKINSIASSNPIYATAKAYGSSYLRRVGY